MPLPNKRSLQSMMCQPRRHHDGQALWSKESGLGRVTGLGSQQVEIAMLVTPDGHSRLEVSRFLAPPVVADHRRAPVNALGYLRVMFR
jgi:hypothetical protein